MTKYWGPSAGGLSTGTWDASSVTNWFDDLARTVRSTVAPTSADDVVFDAASDAGAIFTVTVGTGAVCRNFTAGSLDFIMTLAGTASPSIYGSLLLPATRFTSTQSGGYTFLATTTGNTITTNGVTISGAVFNGAGGEWILGSALTTSNSITHARGTLRTNNFNINCGSFISNSGTARSIYLGSATLTINGSLFTVTAAGMTVFDAGTSTINIAAASITFSGGRLTYYNVTFTSTSGGGAAIINDVNTFNNLSFASAGTTIRFIALNANQVINGTLTLGTANTAVKRLFVYGNPVATRMTLTCNAVAALSDVDFRAIGFAGNCVAGGNLTGTRLGNATNNSGITFDAPKTVYWSLLAGGSWTSTAWATSSGGTPNVNNYPLVHDAAIIDNAGLSTGATITASGTYPISTLDASGRTNAWTLAYGTAYNEFLGDLKLSPAATVTGTTGYWLFSAYNTTQMLATAGVAIPLGLQVQKGAGALQLSGNANFSNPITLTSGGIDLNNQTLTASIFASNNSNVRSIAFGTGNINLTGNATDLWNTSTATNFSYTGTPNVNLTYAGATGTRVIYQGATAGGSESNIVNFNITAGSDTITTQTNIWLKNLNFTGFTGTWTHNARSIYGDLTLGAGMTVATGGNVTNFSATSGVQKIKTNGVVINFAINKLNAGSIQLQDNAALGSSLTFTHTAGSLDLNAKTLTVGAYSSTGAVARDIKFNNGSIVDLGAWTVSGSNFTTSGVGTISMASSSAKTFAGGGFSYPTLNQGGAGDLTITGANRFKDMTNTVQPCAVVLPASTITSVENFSLNGTPGNLVSIRSSVAGTRFTLNKVAP